jgi:hypothetical protein
MPESRNSGIGSEVDFLGNELLRQLHDHSYSVPRQPIVRFCMPTEELNCWEKCSLFSGRRTTLRELLEQLREIQS